MIHKKAELRERWVSESGRKLKCVSGGEKSVGRGENKRDKGRKEKVV